jgi:hypothetical protein
MWRPLSSADYLTKSLRCQNLALNGDLMFDQGDVLQRVKEIYGDHCHV